MGKDLPSGSGSPQCDLDRIKIKDLLLRGIVGVNDEERRKLQDILINLTVWTDTRPAARSDDIADTVNYRTLTKSVIALVEASSYFTVEKMAAEIARLILTEPGVAEVEVSVEKPGALRFARSVGVSIRRCRSDFTA